MKKIILFTVIIIFIPFVIVSFFKIDKKEEINLNYESNTIIRVKRLSSGEIEYLKNILLVCLLVRCPFILKKRL